METRIYVNLVLVLLGAFVNDIDADEAERLVGGRMATQGEFPFTVSLRYRGKHFCGATLIDRQHVLTAAHCVYEKEYKQFTIVTGTLLLNSGGETHNVTYIYSHPRYSPSYESSFIHDIALIKLKNPIVESYMQKPIALATSRTASNVTGVIIGWGTTKLGTPASVYQRKAYVNILENRSCQDKLEERIHDTQMCTFKSRDDGGICKGDSGGPLVYKNELVGVASWAYLCATGVPDVFSRVFEYRKFIEDAIAQYG